MDRRIKRTRRILSQAFLELLKQSDFHDISIRDITDHADVAYSTFFRNFESKEALILHYLQELIVEKKATIDSQPDMTFRDKHLYIVRALIEGVYECPNIFSVLYATPEAQSALKVFKQNLIDLTIDMMPANRGNSDIPLELVLDSAMNQLIGIITWWIDRHLEPSIAKILDYYEKLVMESTLSLLWTGVSK